MLKKGKISKPGEETKSSPVTSLEAKPSKSRGVVVSLRNLGTLGDQMQFGTLKVGDRFCINRVAGSPVDSVCPVFTKTELARVDPNDNTSSIYNATYFDEGKQKYGWLHKLIDVTRVL